MAILISNKVVVFVVFQSQLTNGLCYTCKDDQTMFRFRVSHCRRQISRLKINTPIIFVTGKIHWINVVKSSCAFDQINTLIQQRQ